MNLFQCASARLGGITIAPAILTPLGRIHLTATIDDIVVTDNATTFSYLLPSDGRLHYWHWKDFDLELLVCRPLLQDSGRELLTECFGALWRLRARADISSCVLIAAWENSCTWKEGGPNSGQWWYTKTWSDEQTDVSVGTADGDLLGVRADRGDGLPLEWSPYFHPAPNQFDWFSLQMVHTEVGDNGVPVPLPPLKVDQQCQIHFGIAWASSNANTTSFGVELTASEILAGVDCS